MAKEAGFVPSGTARLAADSGVTDDGGLLVVFDLEEEREYSVMADAVVMLEPPDESLDKGVLAMARTSILVDDLDGGIRLVTSSPPADVRAALNRALASIK